MADLYEEEYITGDDEFMQHETDFTSEASDVDQEITEDHVWPIIDAYFKERNLVAQQVDSFDEFILVTLQSIVHEKRRVSVVPELQYQAAEARRPRQYDVIFEQVHVSPPLVHEFDGEKRHLYPHEARLRNLTYHAQMYVDVVYRQYKMVNGEAEQEPCEETSLRTLLGCIPIMVRSRYCSMNNKNFKDCMRFGECMYDQGGYFIINGSEKVLITQERMSNNHVYVFKKKQPSVYSWVCETRSHVPRTARPTSTMYLQVYQKPPRAQITAHQIRAQLPYLKRDIPVVVLFRALGLDTDREIIEHIMYDPAADPEMLERFRPSLEEADLIRSREVALDYIGKRGNTPYALRAERINFAVELVHRELLPHVGVGDRYDKKKGFFMGYVVHKMLMCSLGRLGEDDRDHFGKKRLDMSGPLMSSLFRQLFAKLVADLRKSMQKELENGRNFNVTTGLKSKSMTDGLKYSLATGNWGDRSRTTKQGISQVLNRLTFASSLSHLRRLNTPIAKEGKLARPRQLHATHWGVVCPAETPEGGSVGLVKNLALMAQVTVGSDENHVLEFLNTRGMTSLEDMEPVQMLDQRVNKVFVDGNWVGIVDEPHGLVREMKEHRRRLAIDPQVSIVRDVKDREVRIYTDPGRICRPLLVVDYETQQLKVKRTHVEQLEDNDTTYGWMDLLRDGLIEYIDVEEEETTMIAMEADKILNKTLDTYTHCEIHPSLILGVCASIIPFPDHNQSPRNVYQSAMGKQAMGIYASNFMVRMDTMAHVLLYPQMPLTYTRAMAHLKFRELPSGVNAVVAIACYTGYNQEDSLILSQSSVDRGFMRSLYFRTYSDSLDSNREQFEVPQRAECSGMGSGKAYDKLGYDGLVGPGMHVSGELGDVLIGKTVPAVVVQTSGRIEGAAVKKDESTVMKSTEKGIVDRVLLSTNDKGFSFVKVRIRNIRTPNVGDKFASRHGQKGTVGLLYRQEDLPFSCDGITPDIVVNPHAIPSRMTVGHLVECLLSKASALLGMEGDATPFMAKFDVASVMDVLHGVRYQRYGNECLYSGYTGRPLTQLIFFGPTFYQRLKHLVDDKIHARARGTVTSLTRQPMEGRARGGGLRMGEMERDCLISHGSANFLRDRLFFNSDPYRVHVCDVCGMMAVADLRKQTFECTYCSNGEPAKFSQVYMPYAGKLLFQELLSMCIAPRIFTDRGEGV